MEQLTTLCEKPVSGGHSFDFWHKLYADDLVLIVHYEHLETLMANLRKVSDDHELIINPKKCAVLAVRNHSKIALDAKLLDIPITTQYCYLGVTIDNCGSIQPQL